MNDLLNVTEGSFSGGTRTIRVSQMFHTRESSNCNYSDNKGIRARVQSSVRTASKLQKHSFWSFLLSRSIELARMRTGKQKVRAQRGSFDA